jgi:hypothetical protein
VKDKGRIVHGSVVSWVIPGEGLQLRPYTPTEQDTQFIGVISAILVLGEIAHLDVLLSFSQPQTVRVSLSLAQVKHAGFVVEQTVSLELDTGLIHVMPLKVRA